PSLRGLLIPTMNLSRGAWQRSVAFGTPVGRPFRIRSADVSKMVSHEKTLPRILTRRKSAVKVGYRFPRGFGLRRRLLQTGLFAWQHSRPIVNAPDLGNLSAEHPISGCLGIVF